MCKAMICPHRRLSKLNCYIAFKKARIILLRLLKIFFSGFFNWMEIELRFRSRLSDHILVDGRKYHFLIFSDPFVKIDPHFLSLPYPGSIDSNSICWGTLLASVQVNVL